jgi:hypothetical protein
MNDENEIKNQEDTLISDEIIISKIYLIRGEKVMLDRDLAQLYNVETKYLKRQVKRNIDRFPEDFMFQLSKEEFTNWRNQFVTSNSSDYMRRWDSHILFERPDWPP